MSYNYLEHHQENKMCHKEGSTWANNSGKKNFRALIFTPPHELWIIFCHISVIICTLHCTCTVLYVLYFGEGKPLAGWMGWRVVLLCFYWITKLASPRVRSSMSRLYVDTMIHPINELTSWLGPPGNYLRPVISGLLFPSEFGEEPVSHHRQYLGWIILHPWMLCSYTLVRLNTLRFMFSHSWSIQ